MNAFFETILLACVWILAQNLVLTGGYAITPVLRAPKNGRLLLIFSGLITAFSFLASMLCMPVSLFLSLFKAGVYFLPLAFVLIVGLLYFGVVLLLKRFSPLTLKKLKPLLAPAAFNTLVLAVLF